MYQLCVPREIKTLLLHVVLLLLLLTEQKSSEAVFPMACSDYMICRADFVMYDIFGVSCFGVSSDLDGSRGALKREVFFHTFLCLLV